MVNKFNIKLFKYNIYFYPSNIINFILIIIYMKFCGKFKGCVRETLVNDKGVSETEYKAVMRIKSINCSNKTSFLINILDSEGETKNLAYLENANKQPVLRSISEFGNGITSTYFDGKYLIHEVSTVKSGDKNKSWKVKYYKFKQC